MEFVTVYYSFETTGEEFTDLDADSWVDLDP